MAKELRIGLIGCGDVTHVFTAPSIRAARNARMVIAMDPLPEIADRFEQAFEVPVTTRLEDVLENGAVDAVVVSTPHLLGSAGQIYIHTEEVTTHRVGGARYLKLAIEKETAGFKAGCWNEIDLPNVNASAVFMERFAQAALEGRSCEVPGEEGRKVLEMILAACQSGRTHQAVTLPLA